MTPLNVSRPPAAAGTAWIKEGWRLFMLAPIPWTGMTALVFLVLIAIGKLPVVGILVVLILWPFILAGYLAASRGGSNGEPISFIYLGAGWKESRQTFWVMGMVLVVAVVLAFYLVNFLYSDEIKAALQMANSANRTPEQDAQMIATALPALGLGSLFLAPLLMALWLAPGLVLFEGFPAGRALWWSLWACWVNWRPFLVYNLILGLISLAARLAIPLNLELLVIFPLTLTSTYAAYQTIFSPAEQVAAVSETA